MSMSLHLKNSGGLAVGPGGGMFSGLFEGARKFKKGAKNFVKFDGSITFFPAPRGRSHGRSIQMHLMQTHQSLS